MSGRVIFFRGPTPEFQTEFEAREWCWANGVTFYDARFKRVFQTEDGYVWQVISRRVPRPIVKQCVGDYVGVSEKAETQADILRRRAQWARELAQLLGIAHERENWSSPYHKPTSAWLHRAS